METEQLKQLIHAVSSSKLQEFQYEESGIKIAMKKEGTFSGKAADIGKITVETSESSENDPEPDTGEHLVRSPLVGTFYTAPEEGAPPYVQAGDVVKKGQTLAIVEAMKLMNEIECDQDGIITNIYVKNGENVEYGQPLFGIR